MSNSLQILDTWCEATAARRGRIATSSPVAVLTLKACSLHVPGIIRPITLKIDNTVTCIDLFNLNLRERSQFLHYFKTTVVEKTDFTWPCKVALVLVARSRFHNKQLAWRVHYHPESLNSSHRILLVLRLHILLRIKCIF